MKARLLAGTIVVVLLLGCLAAFLQWQREREEHLRWYRTIDCLIIQLIDQHPSDLSDNQWAMCLSHTWNLHTNYGGFENWTAEPRRRFSEAFRQKLQQKNGLATIEWFWDAYVAAVPQARNYRHYRPIQPSGMLDASPYDLMDIRRTFDSHDCTNIETVK